MTVCVAAICENAMIWGASDRLISKSDGSQYESGSPKYRVFDQTVVAMWAGDVALQSEILSRVETDVTLAVAEYQETHPRLSEKELQDLVPEKLRFPGIGVVQKPFRISVEQVARSYLSSFDTTKQWRLGRSLTQDELEDEQKRLDGLEAIIVGVDSSGPRIWSWSSRNLFCEAQDGFAVVGIGHVAASPFLERLPQTPSSGNQRTQFMVYAAKREADTWCGGVGKTTDMFGIGFLPRSFQVVPQDGVERLESVYDHYLENVTKARDQAIKEQMDYVYEALRRGDEEARKQGDAP